MALFKNRFIIIIITDLVAVVIVDSVVITITWRNRSCDFFIGQFWTHTHTDTHTHTHTAARTHLHHYNRNYIRNCSHYQQWGKERGEIKQRQPDRQNVDTDEWSDRQIEKEKKRKGQTDKSWLDAHGVKVSIIGFQRPANCTGSPQDIWERRTE